MQTRAEHDYWECEGTQRRNGGTKIRGKNWRRRILGRKTARSCCPVPTNRRTSGPDAREDKTPEALSRWKGKYWRLSTSSLQRPLWLTRSSCWWWVFMCPLTFSCIHRHLNTVITATDLRFSHLWYSRKTYVLDTLLWIQLVRSCCRLRSSITRLYLPPLESFSVTMFAVSVSQVKISTWLLFQFLIDAENWLLKSDIYVSFFSSVN